MRLISLRIATVVLLQNETNVYYKVPVYYKSIVILRGPSRFYGHEFNQFDGQ